MATGKVTRSGPHVWLAPRSDLCPLELSALPKEAQASPRGSEGILGVIGKGRFQLQVTENQIHGRSSARAGVHLKRLEAGSAGLGCWLSPLRLSEHYDLLFPS